MRTYHSCIVCHRDAYHYGQSPDLIFPHHGLHYMPMDAFTKRGLVARWEPKIGSALPGGGATMPAKPPQITYIVVKPQIDIQYDPEPKLVLESNPVRKQMRVVYTSNAWEELVCQNWVTVKTELMANGDEIAIMEQF